MLNLGDVLEWVNDGLHNGAFAKQQPIHKGMSTFFMFERMPVTNSLLKVRSNSSRRVLER